MSGRLRLLFFSLAILCFGGCTGLERPAGTSGSVPTPAPTYVVQSVTEAGPDDVLLADELNASIDEVVDSRVANEQLREIRAAVESLDSVIEIRVASPGRPVRIRMNRIDTRLDEILGSLTVDIVIVDGLSIGAQQRCADELYETFEADHSLKKPDVIVRPSASSVAINFLPGSAVPDGQTTAEFEETIISQLEQQLAGDTACGDSGLAFSELFEFTYAQLASGG